LFPGLDFPGPALSQYGFAGLDPIGRSFPGHLIFMSVPAQLNFSSISFFSNLILIKINDRAKITI
jgi:hypothetical protein